MGIDIGKPVHSQLDLDGWGILLVLCALGAAFFGRTIVDMAKSLRFRTAEAVVVSVVLTVSFLRLSSYQKFIYFNF